MEHVYIHFPFCLKICHYCDFYSVAYDQELINKYVSAVCSEIKLASREYSGKLGTIYFGGGTPSLLEPCLLEKILATLLNHFSFATKIEITLETNPETFAKEKFLNFKKAGINRISLGIQSFDNKELTYLGRVHSAEKAIAAARSISELFTNFNLDLIYGLPQQNKASLIKTLTQAVKLQPQHLSLYELTFEPETPLYQKKQPLTDEEIINLAALGKEFLQGYNYQQYEISNYALAGFECQHNLAYWSDKSYLGFGPAAHSYDQKKKQRKIITADLALYLKQDFPTLYQDEEAKNIDSLIMELRKTKGMPAKKFRKICGQKGETLLNKGYFKVTGNNIALTDQGFLIMNTLLLELMD